MTLLTGNVCSSESCYVKQSKKICNCKSRPWTPAYLFRYNVKYSTERSRYARIKKLRVMHINSPMKPVTIDQGTVLRSMGKEREEWLAAIKEELQNQMRSSTFSTATTEDLEELLRLCISPTPSRMVFVQKPGKKKARLVVCGQFLCQFQDTATANLETAPLRAMIATGWKRGNVLASMDITAAFLHAYLPKDRFLVIAPPPVLISMGVLEKGTYWIVRKALYGQKGSPKTLGKVQCRKTTAPTV